jgi:hypothetical protein
MYSSGWARAIRTRRHDEVLQVVRVEGRLKGEPWQDAAADVEVLVGDELPERGLPPRSATASYSRLLSSVGVPVFKFSRPR